MTDGTTSQYVELYFTALKDHDIDAVAALVHDDAQEVIPMSPNGELEPWFHFRGKDEVLRNVGATISNFSQVEFVDREVNVVDDGRTVFVETKGHLVVAASGASYRNVYVFRFSFNAEGLITEIREYANPVPYAVIFGSSLGR